MHDINTKIGGAQCGVYAGAPPQPPYVFYFHTSKTLNLNELFKKWRQLLIDRFAIDDYEMPTEVIASVI